MSDSEDLVTAVEKLQKIILQAAQMIKVPPAEVTVTPQVSSPQVVVTPQVEMPDITVQAGKLPDTMDIEITDRDQHGFIRRLTVTRRKA